MALPVTFNKSWAILGAAVVFGGIAVFASSRYISSTIDRERAKLNPNVEQVDVVVAKSDLEAGSIVAGDTMAVRRMPKEFVPGTAVLPDTFGNFEGAKLAVDMRAGEVLLRGTIDGADSATFATKIARGVRAITLRVDEVNSLSGLLQPGDHVDLFFTARPQTGRGNTRAKDQTALLMQDVEVLATGRQVRPTVIDGSRPGTGRTFSTVTVEASARDAQRLILAEKAGAITAVLRGAEDRDPLVASTMDVSALFGAPASKRARRARVGPMAEVIVGGQGRLARQMVPLGPPSAARSPAAALPLAVPAAAANAATAAAGFTDPQGVTALRALVEATRPPAEATTMPSRTR
jgi:pilus assembly protein CpaB